MGRSNGTLYVKEGIKSHKLKSVRGLNCSTESLRVEIPGLKNSLELGMLYQPLDQNVDDFEM